MSRFSGPQFRGAQRQMKLQRRTEAEKRQALHDERMKQIQALIPVPVLGVVEAPTEMELFAPDEVEVKKTRVRRRGKHVADTE